MLRRECTLSAQFIWDLYYSKILEYILCTSQVYEVQSFQPWTETPTASWSSSRAERVHEQAAH